MTSSEDGDETTGHEHEGLHLVDRHGPDDHASDSRSAMCQLVGSTPVDDLPNDGSGTDVW